MKHDLVTRIVGRVLVLLESADAPSDPEWDRCLGLLAEFRDDFSRVKVLVITAGGGPTPPQRRRLSAVTQEHSVHVAVVSDSMRVRFIVASAALSAGNCHFSARRDRDGLSASRARSCRAARRRNRRSRDDRPARQQPRVADHVPSIATRSGVGQGSRRAWRALSGQDCHDPRSLALKQVQRVG